MQQREVRVYLLDALAASEQIVSIRDEVGARTGSCALRSSGT
jgi:hypothetical protein